MQQEEHDRRMSLRQQAQAAPSETPAQVVLFTVGEKYEVLKLIGSGSFGSVYRARHSITGQMSALKLLNLSSEEDRKRFEREAQIVARLSHPNIVALRDFGLNDDCTPYMVMELVEGESLADVLKREGRLAPERVIGMFLQICDALQHAHEAGVCHRDIKPSNILINRRGGIETAKLADFGIAKQVLDDKQLESLTATGALLGTPLYMSPEQSQGHQCTPASDQYSLGCVMYECFSGQPPVVGENFLDTVYKRLHEMPKSLSELGLKVPGALENVIMRCLSIEPVHRYPSIEALARDLRAAADGATIPRPKPPGSAPKQTLIMAMLATLLSLTLAVVFWGLNRDKAPVAGSGDLSEQVVSAEPREPIVAVPPEVPLPPAGRRPAKPDGAGVPEPPVDGLPEGMTNLRLLVKFQGGQSGLSGDVTPVWSEESGLTESDYRRLTRLARVREACTRWKAWYGHIFDAVNPPPGGKGPPLAEQFFGTFTVTVNSDKQIDIMPEFHGGSAADDIHSYVESVVGRLRALAGTELLSFPERCSHVSFELSANGSEGRFELHALDAPIVEQ